MNPLFIQNFNSMKSLKQIQKESKNHQILNQKTTQQLKGGMILGDFNINEIGDASIGTP